MGTKTNNLKNLIRDNINVHEFKEIDNLNDLIKFSDENDKFTMRFDQINEVHNLPFYLYNRENIKDKNKYFSDIIDEMKSLNCTLLCSNGYQYDDDMKFNFVIEIYDQYDFILELSDKKVPLRHMYNYKTTIIRGNLLDRSFNFEYLNKQDNKYSIDDIEYIIRWLISLNNKYKYIEGTLYTKSVGILNNNLIIWQTN